VPQTDVVFFANSDGIAPVVEWLDSLPTKVQDKCIAFLQRLSEKGHELRRPDCDFLRDDIYELRIGRQGINYRVLYFFHQNRAVLSHGLIKEKEVPFKEIDTAIANRLLYVKNPDRYTFRG
jgi:phage-related protein